MVEVGPRYVTAGISIVCVYNNPEVRAECLDRSLAAYSGSIDVDYIAVDNTEHEFQTAGGALNHGARQAKHDLVAFVHQDVYVHSIDRLVAAAKAVIDGDFGVIGANGVTHAGLNVGRMRDRAQVIGQSAPDPVEVDSVDEVLFITSRSLVLSEPLTEDPHLAWHAYAVEYGMRLRAKGLRVGAMNLGITHNSLTVNLAKLDEAHAWVGARYPESRPVHTTCGIIGSVKPRWRSSALVRDHGWRLRWFRHSIIAFRARRHLRVPVVLSDIRHEIDLLPISSERPLHLVNIDQTGGFAEYGADALELTRYGHPVVVQAVHSIDEVPQVLSQLPDDSLSLIVGLRIEDLSGAGELVGDGRHWLLGIHPAEMWLLAGYGPDRLPQEWSRREAQPLGFRRVDQASSTASL